MLWIYPYRVSNSLFGHLCNNKNLRRVPFAKAIHATIFDMNPMSTPKLDGFTGKFLQHFLDIIGTNVISETKDYIKIGRMHLGTNSNF